MSLVNNIDKVFQNSIAKNFEGLHHDQNGVVIILNKLNIQLLDKDCKVMDNRLSELSEPIRRELSGQYDNSKDLMQAFVSRVQEEINSFFIQIAQGFVDTLKAKITSEKRILAVYEGRLMIDFLQDSGFKNKISTKETELIEFGKTIGINPNVDYSNQAELNMLINELLNECKVRYSSVFQTFSSFLGLMKNMLELTQKVNGAKGANSSVKENALKNLNLINEITYQEMQSIPTVISGLDIELQKKMLTSSLTKQEFLAALK